MKSLSIRFSDNLYNQIAESAKKEKRSISAEINMIVERSLEEKQSILSGNSQIDMSAIKKD